MVLLSCRCKSRSTSIWLLILLLYILYSIHNLWFSHLILKILRLVIYLFLSALNKINALTHALFTGLFIVGFRFLHFHNDFFFKELLFLFFFFLSLSFVHSLFHFIFLEANIQVVNWHPCARNYRVNTAMRRWYWTPLFMYFLIRFNPHFCFNT